MLGAIRLQYECKYHSAVPDIYQRIRLFFNHWTMRNDGASSASRNSDRERGSTEERQRNPTLRRRPDTVSTSEYSERDYLQVTPGTNAPGPGALHTACKQLYDLGQRGTLPTIEYLLTTSGDGTITYAFGGDDCV